MEEYSDHFSLGSLIDLSSRAGGTARPRPTATDEPRLHVLIHTQVDGISVAVEISVGHLDPGATDRVTQLKHRVLAELGRGEQVPGGAEARRAGPDQAHPERTHPCSNDKRKRKRVAKN